MELAMGFAAFLCFWLGFPAPALVLRCGLNASLRFSPRAALALGAVASVCGAVCALLRRGGLRAAPHAARLPALACAFAGGTLGRALLLMLVARFPGSLTLARIQLAPLLSLTLLALIPLQPPRRGPLAPRTLGALCLLFALADGFLGAGGMLLATRFLPSPIVRARHRPATPALLLTAGAQTGALALTLCAGAAQVFPARMLLAVALGASLGALAGECLPQSKRGTLLWGMRAAVKVYWAVAVLALAEQALRG